LNILNELSETTEVLYNRHLSVSKDWYPHLEIPYETASNYKEKDWSPEQYPLDEAVRSAIYVNLLTEDNLPYYTNTIISHAPEGHPLRDWTMQWTSEEWRHSAVIRDWALATRAIDPIYLEDGRRVQMSKGEVPQPDSLAELMVYTSLQELATQVAHRNTGKMLDKELNGRKIMAMVAGDEGLHHEFYSGLATKAFEIDPSTMVIAALKELKGFKMPGTGIPDFDRHSKIIEKAGIYNIPQFFENVVTPTFNRWDIESLTNLSNDAEHARDKLLRHIALLARIATRSLR
jgi:acyl-[acyl-carrier-protein] desaturase